MNITVLGILVLILAAIVAILTLRALNLKRNGDPDPQQENQPEE